MKKLYRDGYMYLRRGTLWWEAVRESDWTAGYMNAKPVQKEKAVLLEAEWSGMEPEKLRRFFK